MTYSDISVFKWQQLTSLFTNKKEKTDIDLSVEALAICKGITEAQVDSMTQKEFSNELSKITFLHEQLNPKAQRFIKVNGRRYRCVYDVRNIRAARYIESKYFGTDVTNNLHKIAACLVIPQKKVLGIWKDDEYNALKHDEYSQDMLEAPITAVLGSVVFFYHVYRDWMTSSKDYLTKEMGIAMKMEEAELVYQTLCEILDGFTKHNFVQSMNVSHSQVSMN